MIQCSAASRVTNMRRDCGAACQAADSLSSESSRLMAGCCREGRRRSELENTAHRFLSAFRCEPAPVRAADYYATVKITRQQRGLVLDENDLWVVATALAMGATLVSRDRDFAGIDGLAVIGLK